MDGDTRAGEIEPGPGPSEETGPDDVLEVHITRKTIWQGIGAILLTLVLLWTIQAAGKIVGWLAISFFFSLALEPAVRRLVAQRGWRRGTATGVIYAAGLLFGVLMTVVLIPAISQIATTIGENGAEWLSDISDQAEDTFGFELASEEAATELAEGTDAALGQWADDVLGAVVDVASSGIGLVFALVTIAMFTFYLTANAPAVRRAILRLFRPEIQERILWTWGQAIVQTGGYFYSRLVLMIINGLGFFLAMVIAGLPVRIGIPLSLFGGFVSVFIPAIGTYIGGAVPALLALAVEGPAAGLIVIAYVLLYQQIENYWLGPKISANTMSLNGGIAFGAALGGGAIAGPMGAFTALPVAALISSFMSNYVASHEVTQELEPADGVEGSRRRRRNRGRTDTGTDGEATP